MVYLFRIHREEDEYVEDDIDREFDIEDRLDKELEGEGELEQGDKAENAKDIIKGPWVAYGQIDRSLGDIKLHTNSNIDKIPLTEEDIIKKLETGEYQPGKEIKRLMSYDLYTLILSGEDFSHIEEAGIGFLNKDSKGTCHYFGPYRKVMQVFGAKKNVDAYIDTLRKRNEFISKLASELEEDGANFPKSIKDVGDFWKLIAMDYERLS